MYETSGIIDEAFFESIKYYMIPKKTKRLVACCCAIIFIITIVCAFYKMMSAFIVGILGLAMLIITYYMVQNKTLKLSIQRLKESLNKESYVLTTRFLEDGVIVLTDYSQEERLFKYDNLYCLVESKTCYILYTKALQYIIIFKDQLTESEKKGLVEFLISKSIKIDANINL